MYTALTHVLTFVQNYNLWIGEAIRQFMYVGLAFGLLQWTESQQHAVLQMISALVTAYAAKANVSVPKHESRKQEAFDKGVVQGTAAASSGPGNGTHRG